jgi:hypothetical protein
MANQIKKGEKKTQTVNSQGSIFSKIEHGVDLDTIFDKYFSGKYLGYLIYVLIVGLLYISNSHVNDKLTRKHLGLKKELEGLRAEYVTLKQEYLQNSSRSEVARRVKEIGLEDDGGKVYRLEEYKR